MKPDEINNVNTREWCAAGQMLSSTPQLFATHLREVLQRLNAMTPEMRERWRVDQGMELLSNVNGLNLSETERWRVGRIFKMAEATELGAKLAAHGFALHDARLHWLASKYSFAHRHHTKESTP
jgi:hypothetical protein